MMNIKNMIPNWKEILKNATTEKKKMILSSIIKEVVVYDDKIENIKNITNEELRYFISCRYNIEDNLENNNA